MTRKQLYILAMALIALLFPSGLRAQVDLGEYTLIRDYDFGTAECNSVRSIEDLSASFNPYGVAGTTVINREWQRYQPFNTVNHAFSNGDLVLTALPNLGGVNNGGISSGQVTTKDVFYPRDGKTLAFQLRAKVPSKVGAWPAFWIYSPGGPGSTTSEIDIFEFFDTPTQSSGDWTGFDHGSGVGPDYYSIMTNQWVWRPGYDFADAYHIYTLVWAEGIIQKWVDGTMVKGTEFIWYGPDPQVLINLAVGGNSNNVPTSSAAFPYRFFVDYFRVYEKSSALSLTTNKALGKVGFSSSNESPSYMAVNAFDGNPSTRWSSYFSDPQWVAVDLDATYAINRVVLRWKSSAYGKSYEIQTSEDAITWTTIYSTDTGDSGVDDIQLTGVGRYVRMYGTKRGSGFGYSLYEFEVYGNDVSSSESDTLICQ